MSSLSGQNSNGRISGTRSSRVSSTIFYKLRDLDRKITEIDELINSYTFACMTIAQQRKIYSKRFDLDEKRKSVRNKRKNHGLNKDSHT
jgi:hypothetical protein